jgi:AraC-like DNA-binding protein/quercetin dioxygenase-like cupin family protein
MKVLYKQQQSERNHPLNSHWDQWSNPPLPSKDLFDISSTELMEKIQHGSEAFNFAIYDSFENYGSSYFPSHWHTEFEINYVQSGEIIFIVAGKETLVKANEIIFINQHAIHSAYSSSPNAKYISILFGESLLSSGFSDIIYQKYLVPLRANKKMPPDFINSDTVWGRKIIKYVKSIIRHVAAKKSTYEMEIKIELLQIFNVFVKDNLIFENKNDDSITNVIVKSALTYIHKNFDKNIQVNLLATELGFCTEHLIRSFRLLVGKTPKEYIIHYRIRYAKLLMQHDSDMTISEIADKCGLSDASYFSRCFKKMTGVTPQTYRANFAAMPASPMPPQLEDDLIRIKLP